MALLPSSRRKGLGLKFEDEAKRPLPGHEAFGLDYMGLTLAAAIPDTYLDHETDIPVVDGKRFIYDQGATSSCVANAFMHGVILRERREGHEFDAPSRLYPYYNARRESGRPVWDSGTYLRACAHGLRVHGTCSEQFWKWSQLGTKVNRRPNWNAMRHAHPRRGGRYVRIYEAGTERIQAVQQAILAGHDVAFGTRLGVSFLSSAGDVMVDVPPATEKVAGNHAMLIIGWQTFEGRVYFRVLNSWGRGWRDGGLCWMSAEYIGWSRTNDLHIIYGWERIRT